MKEIHQLTLSRTGNEPFGFRIVGGKEQGRTFKVEKVLCGFPAANGGMVEEDFLVSINGQDIFDLNHAQVVGLIKNSGSTLRLAVERGDHIVPNFEEIWPSGKPRRQRRGAPSAPTKGIAYIEHAMATGILGEKDKDFTTVGKPKVTTNQYDNPINCYSEETLEEMTEQGTTWKKTEQSVAGVEPDMAKFNPGKSAVLAVLHDAERGHTFAR